ncbi:DUF4115 domain-containing protein [Microbulbifer sp. CAU 1566]|uniref:RodZ domain-containing protein n=1 Tax=Microbulbifer sp. CAU 1566 TaxID=2933269 RepID=UPI00200380E1|nr:RodZ domain-containing protein [Microbulbifer sp. CAU 1566]MCK7595861.1 DUF4115 domain-containing protein [Microbulbifer sp. CAU 1566]
MSSSNSIPDSTGSEEMTASESTANTVGSQLLAAREAAGLEREELARRLCMTPDKLEALEKDAFDRLAGATYVRGYIRNACKELGLDAAPVLEAFAAQVPAEAIQRPAQTARGPVMSDRPTGKNTSQGGSLFAPLSLAIIAAAAGGYWWYGQQGAPAAVSVVNSESAEAPAAAALSELESAPQYQAYATAGAEQEETVEPDAEAQNVVSEAQPESDVELAEAGVFSEDDMLESESAAPAMEAVLAEAEESVATTGDTTSVAEAPSVAAEDVAEEPAAVEDSSPVVENTVPAVEGALALSFSEESWVEVTDAAGSKLLAKLQPAGSSIELTGEAPFSVMLGNAAAATVSYGGEVVDSAPLGNRRTRKLVVGG